MLPVCNTWPAACVTLALLAAAAVAGRGVKLGVGNGREDPAYYQEVFRIVQVRDGQEVFGDKHLHRLSDSLGTSVSFGQ